MKIGLYSITYLGVWYRGETLSIREFIARARQFGFEGIELGGKRPHANPLDLDERARDQIREDLDRYGLDLMSVASYNDFSSPVPEHRECQVLMAREQIRLAKDLRSRIVRLFAAWPGVTIQEGLGTYDVARSAYERAFPGVSRLERWNFVKGCLKEVARYAEEDGIILALQNHVPLIRHHRDMLDLVREVDSPHLKACLDAPLLTRQDDASVRQAVLETGTLQVHSHFGGEWKRMADGGLELQPRTFGEPPTNYPAFVRALLEIGYEGYLCYEFCHPALNERHEPAGIERVDEQVQFAIEYMRKVLSEAVSGPR